MLDNISIILTQSSWYYSILVSPKHHLILVVQYYIYIKLGRNTIYLLILSEGNDKKHKQTLQTLAFWFFQLFHSFTLASHTVVDPASNFWSCTSKFLLISPASLTAFPYPSFLDMLPCLSSLSFSVCLCAFSAQLNFLTTYSAVDNGGLGFLTVWGYIFFLFSLFFAFFCVLHFKIMYRGCAK